MSRVMRSALDSHQLQGVGYFAIGEHVEEGRLLQIDGQRLFERAVENRIAGGVGEIGDHERVSRSQLRRSPRTIVERTGNDQGGGDCNG